MGLLTKNKSNPLYHRGREVLAYLFNYLKPKPAENVRVVIFAQGRTGSSLLASLLSSTGYFKDDREPLDVDYGEILCPIQYIRGLTKWKSNENYIFHVKIYQLTSDRKRPVEPVEFIETLYKEGFKVIYISRKNIVNHSLSNVVAEQRGGRYHKWDDKKEDLNLSIDCDSFIELVKERVRYSEEEKKVLANITYHEVVYEDDLEIATEHQKTIDRILDFLTLERKTAVTKHRKVNTMPMEKLITNYEEFYDCMKEHGWQNFINE